MLTRIFVDASVNLLTRRYKMQHYKSTIINKYKTGKLDNWVAWIKRGRSSEFCNQLDNLIAEQLDIFFEITTQKG